MPTLCIINETVVVPNSDPCQIFTPLVLVGLGLGVGEGLGLGLGNQVAISTRGVIIWQGIENGHNTGTTFTLFCFIQTQRSPSCISVINCSENYLRK